MVVFTFASFANVVTTKRKYFAKNENRKNGIFIFEFYFSFSSLLLKSQKLLIVSTFFILLSNFHFIYCCLKDKYLINCKKNKINNPFSFKIIK